MLATDKDRCKITIPGRAVKKGTDVEHFIADEL